MKNLPLQSKTNPIADTYTPQMQKVYFNSLYFSSCFYSDNCKQCSTNQHHKEMTYVCTVQERQAVVQNS